jgi:hypothetical protein
MSSGLYGAAQQVGRNPVERLTWLLELSQMGDEELARRDPHDMLDEIMFFTLAGGHVTSIQPRADVVALDGEFLTPVRSRLEDLRRDEPFTVREPKLIFGTSIKHGRTLEGSAPALFLWQAWNLVDEHHELLHRCQREQCDRWFVAVRPLQKYCSSACSQIIRNRSYQNMHSAEHHRELRRRSYLKTKARAAAAGAPIDNDR